MPDNKSSSSSGYTYTGSGTNSQASPFYHLTPMNWTLILLEFSWQGNHYCSRQGDDGGHGYHYSNK